MFGSFGPQSQPKWQGALRRYGPPGSVSLGRSSCRTASRSAPRRTAEPKSTADLVVAGYHAAGHVPAPGPEHVVGLAHEFAVEADLRQRVEAVEDEGQALLGRHGGT